jgi:hypothetical protein
VGKHAKILLSTNHGIHEYKSGNNETTGKRQRQRSQKLNEKLVYEVQEGQYKSDTVRLSNLLSATVERSRQQGAFAIICLNVVSS